MSRRLKIALVVGVVAAVGALAIWPPFLMPSGLYEIVYGWRYPVVRECGDGTLTERGPAVSSDRYVVDFGYVSLDRQTESTLVLCGLPRDWMVLGLEYEVPEEARSALDAGELSDIGIHDVEVGASVAEHESGITIVSHEGQLGNQWIWSHGHPTRPAFLYSSDTMFAPTAGRTYEIRIAVAPGDNSTDARARLLVKGGGWKSNQPPSDPSVRRLRDLSTNEEN